MGEHRGALSSPSRPAASGPPAPPGGAARAGAPSRHGRGPLLLRPGRAATTRAAWGLALAVPIGFLAVFFAWPVAAIVGRGLAPGGDLDLSVLGDVLGDADLRQVAWFSAWQAVASTVLTVVVALPGAWRTARRSFPGKALLRAFTTVPFVMPTVVVGAAFRVLLGPGGPLGVDLVGCFQGDGGNCQE